MKKLTIFIYGILSYVMFLGVCVWGIGFIGNIKVSNSLDALPNIPFSQALMINLGLLALFAIQHSVMARPAFKKWFTKYIPNAAERPTYVFLSNVAMVAIFWFWEPMGGVIWSTESEFIKNSVLTFYMFGWALVVIATFLIDHFHFFGLKQIWCELKRQKLPPAKFVMPSLYKRVRHPLYVGWLIVFWATPIMTVSHLVFALMCTAYILVAVQFEEKDLEAEFGEKYRQYKEAVPMIIPALKARKLTEKELVSKS